MRTSFYQPRRHTRGGHRPVRLAGFLLVVLPLLLVGLAMTTIGCAPKGGEGFAIYLLADDPPPSDLTILSHIKAMHEPLIAGDDLVAYAEATHEMELTAAAYKRVRDLQVPLTGRSFGVFVDGVPVYAGAFMTPLWSGSFDGVVILRPLEGETPPSRYTLQIELGYPGPPFYSGDDPRSDPTVREALERGGKLR